MPSASGGSGLMSWKACEPAWRRGWRCTISVSGSTSNLVVLGWLSLTCWSGDLNSHQALKGGERLLGRLPVCAVVHRHPCALLRELACHLAGDKPARRRVYLLFPAFGTMMVNPGSMTNARTDRTIAH